MLNVKKDFSIKELIDVEKFVVVLDTNILLNIYRYCPDFSEFAIQCLQVIKDVIFLPSIVRMEYGKHCHGYYDKMGKRIDNAKGNIQKAIESAKKSVLNSLNDLRINQYPDIDVLSEELENKIDELKTANKSFFEDRPVVDFVSRSWDEDLVRCVVDYIGSLKHVLPELTQQEIYEWDEQGERRYKDKIPPGYMDTKNKNGVRMYSDYFIWREILRFAKDQSKDIIFVTGDVKEDWWVNDKEQLSMRPELLHEFEKTGHRIVPLTPEIFYKEISYSYHVERLDNVELALNMTDSEYGELVGERVFDRISTDLFYNAIDYINDEEGHIGTEGIDEFDLVGYEFIETQRVERSGSAFTYQFKFRVRLSGTSYDYWGRDEDTKEVITSYGRDHVFEGYIYVNVEREADIFIDLNDADFESAEIVDGELSEIDYEDRGYDEDDHKDIIEIGKYGNCPDCGVPLNMDNDGGNGFCIKCSPNH